ncbi:MAG: hypothetical protein II297_05670 [Clostridia bacterium]|nr:hypothetical protein [Clostridia bacterium]
MANKKKNNAKTKIWALPLSALLGITVTVAISATMVMIGGRLAYGTDDPAQYSCAIGIAALYVSTFLGGLFSCVYNERRFISAVIHSAAILLLITTASVLSGGTFGQSILLKLLLIPCSLAGGVAGCVKLSKKKKPKFKERSR